MNPTPRDAPPATLSITLHRIFHRANAPGATFADMVDVVLVTADWSSIPPDNACAAQDLLCRFADQLDLLGLKPGATSRVDLHAAAHSLLNLPPEQQQVGEELADLLLLAAGRRQGAFQ